MGRLFLKCEMHVLESQTFKFLIFKSPVFKKLFVF